MARRRLNKRNAAELGAAEKTVKIRRGRMMRKMGARTVPALMRLVAKRGPQGEKSGQSRATLRHVTPSSMESLGQGGLQNEKSGLESGCGSRANRREARPFIMRTAVGIAVR